MEITQQMDRPNLLSLVNIWILCVILLVFASLYGFSFERGSANTEIGAATSALGPTVTDSNVLVRVQNAFIYVLSLVCILPLVKPVWSRLRSSGLIFSLLIWTAISALWSDNPSTSAVNSLRMSIGLALVVYLFERYSAQDIQRLMLLVGTVAALGSLFLIFVLPQYGLMSRGEWAAGAWEGIFGHKNVCGLEMLLLLLPAFFIKPTGINFRILRWVYIVTVLIIIGMTRSAGAWVFTSLCLAFVAVLKLLTRMPKKDAFAIFFLTAGGSVLIGLLALANFDSLMYALGKDPTMTGRTVIWAVLIHSALKHPILGYGFMAFWDGLSGESQNVATTLNIPGYASAESGILELWLELGMVGVVLYAAIFFSAIKDAFVCLKNGGLSQVGLWYVSILFYVVATNLEGGQLLAASSLTCFMPFVAFVGLRYEAQRSRDQAAEQRMRDLEIRQIA